MPCVNGNTNTKEPQHEPDAHAQECSTTLESDKNDDEPDGHNEKADCGGDNDDNDDAEDIIGGDNNGNDGMWIPLNNQTSQTHHHAHSSHKLHSPMSAPSQEVLNTW